MRAGEAGSIVAGNSHMHYHLVQEELQLELACICETVLLYPVHLDQATLAGVWEHFPASLPG